MSIKIIKPGVRLTDPIRFTCERCGCEFEADKKSYHRVYNDMDFGYVINYNVCCPNCGADISVHEDKLYSELRGREYRESALRNIVNPGMKGESNG